jgi:hypothetical protein
MGKWYYQHCAGEVDVYDADESAHAPLFSFEGGITSEMLVDAQRACDAHNAEIAAMAAQPMICACGDQLDGRWHNGAWQCGICADIAELGVERGGKK